MLPWLFAIFLLSFTSARPSSLPAPGHWTYLVSGPGSEDKFSAYKIPAGMPFMGLLNTVKLEDLFSSKVGQLFKCLPRGEFILETLTFVGSQVLVHMGSGDRYLKLPCPGYQPGQYLDLQSNGYHYRLGAITRVTEETCEVNEEAAARIESPSTMAPTVTTLATESDLVWDITAGNVNVPHDDHTHYFCRIVKVPEIALLSKHHIVSLEPIIQPGNEKFVSHIVLKECMAPSSLGETAQMFEDHVDDPGMECYTSDMPGYWHFCTIVIGWSVGYPGIKLPEHVGLPMGEHFGGATYYRLQVHYDNPDMESDIVDNSGLRITYIGNVREMDMGMLDTGVSVNMLHMIPPRQDLFTSTGHCTSECTSQALPEGGITVFLGFFKMHLAGRKIRVRHVRDGKELPILIEENNFNFQDSKLPASGSEVLVLPGDTLLTECEYDTSDRMSPTYGGLGTQEELCLAFMPYYPRTTLRSCRSGATFSTLMESFGVEKVVGESFEKLLSFTHHQTVGPVAQGDRREIVQKLLTEVDVCKDTIAQLSDESFYGHFRRQKAVLVKILMKIKITIEELFETMNWSKEGLEISKVLAQEEQRCGCFTSDGVTQLLEYQPHKIPSFTEL
eukprot:GFUD01032975.1.p1 GENE.GFUD01032975.1~~GFUD01032975.1.p1  ORF type:complete len:629 (-),score=109.11 GFUD01032975.1:31-1875(-)